MAPVASLVACFKEKKALRAEDIVAAVQANPSLASEVVHLGGASDGSSYGTVAGGVL